MGQPNCEQLKSLVTISEQLLARVNSFLFRKKLLLTTRRLDQVQTISALEALRWWDAKVCLLNGATQPILASILLREGLCMCCEVRKNGCELRKPPILVAHRLADTLLLFVAPWPAIGGSVGNLSPSLFLNPTALSHHVGAQ